MNLPADRRIITAVVSAQHRERPIRVTTLHLPGDSGGANPLPLVLRTLLKLGGVLSPGSFSLPPNIGHDLMEWPVL